MKPESLIAIIIFYNKSHGIQAKLAFSNELRHCNVVTFDGNHWIAMDFTKEGLITRCVKVKDSIKFIHHLKSIPEATAILSVNINERHKVMWKPWLVRSCNEICRYATGVDTGWTFNPRHLYSKLIKYDSRRNYQILTHWRRDDGIIREQRTQPDGRATQPAK
jgi:hypothetical protein